MTGKHRPVLLALSLIVLGKMTGFGKDLLLSFYHGASRVTDAYFIANSVASLSYAAMYMAIPVVVVPYFSRLMNSTEKENRNVRVLPILQFFCLISFVLSIIVFMNAENGVNFLFPDLDAETDNYAHDFIKIISLTFVFSTVVAVLNAVQVLDGKRMASLFVPLVNNCAFIVSILIFPSDEFFKYVIWAGFFSWGALVVVNLHFTRKIVSFIYVSSSPLFKDKKLMVLFLSALMVFYVEQLNSYISVLFASGLGSSAVSYLSYANKLNLLMVSVFIVFLNVYAFPKLSVKRFERQEEMNGFLVKIIKLIAISCFPMVLILYSSAEPVIAIVFERGSFTQSDVIVVASVFQMLILSLPLLLIRDLLNRVIFAYESSSLSLIALLVSVALHVILVKYYMIVYGLPGIAIGVAVSAFINSFILAAFLKLFFNVSLVVDSLKTIVICLASLIISYLLSFVFSSYVGLEWWGESLLMLVGYFYCLYLIREEQSYNIIKWLAFR